MSFTKKLWTPIIFGLLLLFIIAYSGDSAHEQVHQQIAVYHGCLQPRIVMGFDSFFVCDKYENRSVDVRWQEESFHSMNDIMQYNLLPIVVLLFAIVFLLLIMMMEGVTE